MIFLLFLFVLCTEDKSRKIGAVLEIVDDYPFDLRSEGSQDVRKQIMGERSLLLRALLEQRDRQTNALLNVNHESFFLVAKKTVPTPLVAARPKICTSTQRAYSYCSLVTRLPAKIQIAFNR